MITQKPLHLESLELPGLEQLEPEQQQPPQELLERTGVLEGREEHGNKMY